MCKFLFVAIFVCDFVELVDMIVCYYFAFIGDVAVELFFDDCPDVVSFCSLGTGLYLVWRSLSFYIFYKTPISR